MNSGFRSDVRSWLLAAGLSVLICGCDPKTPPPAPTPPAPAPTPDKKPGKLVYGHANATDTDGGATVSPNKPTAALPASTTPKPAATATGHPILPTATKPRPLPLNAATAQGTAATSVTPVTRTTTVPPTAEPLQTP